MNITIDVDSDFGPEKTRSVVALALQDGLIQNKQDQEVRIVRVAAATTLAQFDAEVNRFHLLQAKYRSSGAEDSEPIQQFARFMLRLSKGRIKVPKGVRKWELYSGATVAAEALSEQANKIVALYQDAENTSEINKWIGERYK